MFCINCGQKINDDTVFCPNCGQQQTETSNSTPPQPAAYSSQPVPAQQPQTQPYASYPAAKPKKKHGCLTAFIVFIIIVAAAAACLYFFVPGLLRPYDLGVASSREAYESAMDKLGITKDEAPETGEAEDYTITYGPIHDVSTGLTSEELTSFFNENRPPYYAVKNVQVRINDDGSIEAAGKLDTRYVFNQMLYGQYSKEDARSALPMLGLIPDNINVYFKITGSVTDNQVQDLGIASVKVMGIPLPQSLFDDNISFITNTLDNYIMSECSRTGAYMRSAEVDSGKLSLNGSIPSSIERTSAG